MGQDKSNLISVAIMILAATGMLVALIFKSNSSEDALSVSSNDASENTVESVEQEVSISETEDETAEEVASIEEEEAQSENDTTLENPKFIVDVIYIEDTDKGLRVIGNTATINGYSGVISINIDKETNTTNIVRGNTYVFTVTPMMTRSIPPQVNNIELQEASEIDIEALASIRAEISSFNECMLNYESMGLDAIIVDANMQYANWTDAEIIKYQEFIRKLGYTEEYDIKSIVHTVEQLRANIENESESESESEFTE